MEHYLLEVSRVVWQQEGEQGYHAPYYLTKCSSAALRTKLSLSPQLEYKYLINPDPKMAKGFQKEWEEVIEKMGTMLGCAKDGEEAVAVWKVVAAVLHLGQITFDELPAAGKHEAGSKISDEAEAELAIVAELLGISAEDLRTALTTKTIMKNMEPRTLRESSLARDALAKALYSRLFNVIIYAVNEALSGMSTAPGRDLFIGMLDIFGSEVLMVNGFEQLLINYANDKLQYFFTQTTISHVIKEYEAEGVAGNYLKAIRDIAPTLKMVEGEVIQVPGKAGLGSREERSQCLLSILDDDTRQSDRAQARMTGGSRDDKLLAKILDKLSKSAGFIPLEGPGLTKRKIPDVTIRGEKYKVSFLIAHFGAEVPYCTQGFAEKNADPLDKTLLNLMQTCHESLQNTPFIKQLFEQPAPGGRSLAFKFRDEMERLLSTLQKCGGHFIRCIKPNNERKPFMLDPATCTPQLESCGVKEAAEVAQAGFPKSMTLRDFINVTLKPCAIKSAEWGRLSEEKRGKLCKAVARRVLRATPDMDFVIGKTKIYFRHGGWEKCATRLSTLDKVIGKPGERTASGRFVPPTGLRSYLLRIRQNAMVQQIKLEMRDQAKRQARQAALKRQASMARGAAAAEAERLEKEREAAISKRIEAAVSKALILAAEKAEVQLSEAVAQASESAQGALEAMLVQKNAELEELTEQALKPMKVKLDQLQMNNAELLRNNEELEEFKQEADFVVTELAACKAENAKYRTENTQLRNILAQVLEETKKYLGEQPQNTS
uniref:Myosin motor domain-containing protein n=1 Tax=Haptolina brevifila TaxID=156173 RepID=A0A7S2IWU7_9EUKA|mmetsp:Transcript_72956/g.145052  ORF Transcript_72956/g.145052 Transcript_72956/m.145052 type:complete len:773 (+) Transcript_72956:149-2467(+)